MHRSEINPDVTIREPAADLDGDYGDRPILLEGFTPVDGSDIIVPVDSESPEGFVLALTERQGMQALLALAQQLGKQTSLTAITEDEG